MASLVARLLGFFRPQTEMQQADKDQRALTQGKCPDCGAAPLLAGPQGGASQNIACGTCLSEFTVITGLMILIHRNGRMSPERARSVYGLESAGVQ